MTDDIIRKPTEEQKIASLDEHTKSKKYEWTGIQRGSGDGKRLWFALLDDSSRSSSQHWSIFESWAYERGDYLAEDKEYRKDCYPEIKDDDKWWEVCHEMASEETNDIENWIEDIDDDTKVAEFFDIKFDIIEWDCDNTECINTDEVVAVCSCGYPLAKFDMWNESKDDAECPYCGEDTRTGQEKFVCNI